MNILHIIKNNPFFFITLLAAAFFAALTFRYSAIVGTVEAVCLSAVAVMAWRWYSNSLKRRKEQVKILSASLSTGDKGFDEASAFPLPVLLVNKDGEIIWFNSLFEKLLADFSLLKNNNIDSAIPFRKRAESEEELSSFEAKGDKGSYTVYPARLSDGSFALYFTDDTYLKNIRKKYNMSRPAVLLVNVDSLEQAEDIMPHEDYYALGANIDRLVTKWFVEYNCVFRRFTDGRFFAITEYVNLQAMIQNRFSIIDKIRSEHFGPDEAEITLSIGVGHSLDFKECEDNAREALDMARGRGGDQVAVKTDDGYEFFGGISSGKEKRGKIKSRVFAAALDEYIENSRGVLVMGHCFSDYDCIGAAAGVVAIARAKGKNAHIVVNKQKTMSQPLISMLESGTGAISFISPEKALDEAENNTLLVIVDTMRDKLVEEPKLLNMGLKTVIIDHHRLAVDHIEGSTYELLEPHSSSACEMVTELVQYSPSKPKLTQNQAQALLAGIMLDTKDFTLRVGVRTFDAASFLRANKADTVTVRKLFAGTAEDNIQVNNIVNSAVYYDRYAVAVSSVTGASARLVCSKAADELLSIENVDASFVISSFGAGAINISARSFGRINVQLIMEKLGGGGHHSMAAAQLTDISAQDAFALLKQTVDEYIKSL
ncbi:MAG: DHH family phosphoesterase [Oscillospiraceae bacterium]|nr:DHH family phosphoesterase [Oscillospiraceae bacterium]